MNTSTSMNTQNIYERLSGHEHDHEVRHMFVYGSLRPDDTSGQDWTEDFVRGFSIVARGRVRNAKMYLDGYASVTLGDYGKFDTVEGVVLGLPGVANTRAWNHKVQWADRAVRSALPTDDIECFNARTGDSLLGYERVIVNATVFTPEQGLHEVKAFIYHRPNCARDTRIMSGDWLQRTQRDELWARHSLQDPI